MLEKTTRLVMLYDFYQELLTIKQKQFMELYFQDDLSLGEIAEEFKISRQAVYEHIRRAENLLEEYESKLMLLAKYEERSEIIKDILNIVEELPGNESESIKQKIKLLNQID